jgi:hypothetical protein
VDGGACVNDLLMQFQADLLGIPVVRPAGDRDHRAGRGLPGRPVLQPDPQPDGARERGLVTDIAPHPMSIDEAMAWWG